MRNCARILLVLVAILSATVPAWGGVEPLPHDSLRTEGYIKGIQIIEDGKQGVIRITLKYEAGKQKVIHGLRRVSKPGLRIYSNYEDMPRVMNGLGIAIVSTSKGIMTDKKARANKVGGEILAFVW